MTIWNYHTNKKYNNTINSICIFCDFIYLYIYLSVIWILFVFIEYVFYASNSETFIVDLLFLVLVFYLYTFLFTLCY